MKPVLFIFFSIYSYTLFSTEVENDNSVVIEISELNDALESNSDSADENLCNICYDNPLDPELVCKTCRKKMACRSCMKSIVQSQSTVVRCPHCRGKNDTLLRKKKILSKPSNKSPVIIFCADIAKITFIAGFAGAFYYFLYFISTLDVNNNSTDTSRFLNL